MDFDIKLDRLNKMPIYIQITNHIINDINSGVLKAGTLLPAERKLASMLGINRSTVVNAYSELEAQGYVSSHVGRGTMVTARTDIADAPAFHWQEVLSGHGESLINPYSIAVSELLNRRNLIAMDSGVAAPELYPHEEFTDICSQILLNESNTILQYSCARGLRTLRESLASLMDGRGLTVNPDNIILLNGSHQGVDIVARLLLEPGDAVVIEEPTYIGAIDIFRAYGVKLIGIPVDKDGMLVNHLERVLYRTRPKLIYTIPTYQNPTGACMSMARRQRLLELASKYHVPVVEDDAYGLISFEGASPPTLASMDRSGLVIYLSTISKVLCPGLRVGWMVAPADLSVLASAAKQLSDLHSNNLAQRMVDLYYRKGLFDQRLPRVKEVYRSKRDTMLAALEQYAPRKMSWNIPGGGLYVWATLPEKVSSMRLLQEAVKRKVSFVAGHAFYCSGGGSNKIRLNFTYPPVELINQGIKTLCALIKEMVAESGEKNTAARDIMPIV